jgi:hypothetical protein
VIQAVRTAQFTVHEPLGYCQLEEANSMDLGLKDELALSPAPLEAVKELVRA